MRIVRTKRYLKDLKRLGVSASDISALEQNIANDPNVGDIIQGLKGVRKVRFGFGGRGKRGGGRAIYYLMLSDDAALLITAYAKNEKEDLTAADRKIIAFIVQEYSNG